VGPGPAAGGPPEGWPEVLRLALADESGRIARRYRIGPDQALAALVEVVSGSPALLERAVTVSSPARLLRTAEYRRAVETALSRVYHQLRCYVPARDQLNEPSPALQSALVEGRAAEVRGLCLPLL